MPVLIGELGVSQTESSLENKRKSYMEIFKPIYYFNIKLDNKKKNIKVMHCLIHVLIVLD